MTGHETLTVHSRAAHGEKSAGTPDPVLLKPSADTAECNTARNLQYRTVCSFLADTGGGQREGSVIDPAPNV
jgi:hypothetical protein